MIVVVVVIRICRSPMWHCHSRCSMVHECDSQCRLSKIAKKKKIVNLFLSLFFVFCFFFSPTIFLFFVCHSHLHPTRQQLEWATKRLYSSNVCMSTRFVSIVFTRCWHKTPLSRNIYFLFVLFFSQLAAPHLPTDSTFFVIFYFMFVCVCSSHNWTSIHLTFSVH